MSPEQKTPDPEKQTDKLDISAPEQGDEVLIGPMQVAAWHEAYLHPELGVTDDVIEEAIKFVATEDGNKFRGDVFVEASRHPDKVLYRVVKNARGEIVGFMHCTKHEDSNELGGIYLREAAKGKGVGDQLMEEFLEWSDPRLPSTLQVIAFNDRALNFYRKYGFEKTNRVLEPFEDKFPLVEMVRPADG